MSGFRRYGVCIYIYIPHTHIYIHTHTYTHNGILLSHRKNEILPFAATWIDLENIILSEVSQKQILGLPWWRSG